MDNIPKQYQKLLSDFVSFINTSSSIPEFIEDSGLKEERGNFLKIAAKTPSNLHQIVSSKEASFQVDQTGKDAPNGQRNPLPRAAAPKDAQIETKQQISTIPSHHGKKDSEQLKPDSESAEKGNIEPVKEKGSSLEKPMPLKVTSEPIKEKKDLSLQKNSTPSEFVSKDKPMQTGANFQEFFTLFATLFPHYPLHKTPPDDTFAREMIKRGKELSLHPALIITNSEDKNTLTFLHNLSIAIHNYICPCVLLSGIFLEKENLWKSSLSRGTLKWIFIMESQLKEMKNLQAGLEHIPAKGNFLFGKPVLFLSEYSSFLQDFAKKAALWEEIKYFTSKSHE